MGASYETSLIYGFNVDEERFERWWNEQGFDFEDDGGVYEIVYEDRNEVFTGFTVEYGGNAYQRADKNPWWLGYNIAQVRGTGGEAVNLGVLIPDETRLIDFWRIFGTGESKVGHYLVHSVG